MYNRTYQLIRGTITPLFSTHAWELRIKLHFMADLVLLISTVVLKAIVK